MKNKTQKILLLALAALGFFLVVAIVVNTLGSSDTPSGDLGFESSGSSITDDLSSDEINQTTHSDGTPSSKTNDNSPTPPSVNGKQQITPTIVYAGVFGDRLEISAYAPVVEAGGKCIATISNNSSGKVINRENPATPNAVTTDCALFSIEVSLLSPGTHSITVNYSSNGSEGVSETSEVNIL